MTVVVNAVAAKMGGAATYLRELVRELARVPEAGRFIFYVPPEQANPGLPLPPHLEWRVTRAGHRGPLGRLWWDQVTLRRILRREHADVLYSTANFALFFCPVPQLLLVRNSLYFSEFYRTRILPQKRWSFRLPFALRRWLARVSLRQVQAVMVPSRTLLEEIQASGATLPARVGVNPYGVADRREKPSTTRVALPFKMCYPSLYSEHKNLSTVLQALRLLVESGDTDFEFWTTADPNWRPARTTSTWWRDLRLAQQEALRGRVHFVSPEQPGSLEQLYEGCALVLYPSLVESFGHPLLGALQAGLPVLAADTGSNRELAGDTALYFEGLNPTDLADKIRWLWRNPGQRTAMENRGRVRANGFRWETHAQRLLEMAADCRRPGEP